RARHHQHDARQDPAGFRRPRQAARCDGEGRRRLRAGDRAVQGRRHRRCSARGAVAARGRGVVREILERPAGTHHAEKLGGGIEGRGAGGAHMSAPSLRSSPEWKALAKHWQSLRGTTLQQLFDADGERGTRLTAEGAGLYLDYSKNLVTGETLRLLQRLAKARGVFARRDAMFRGDRINETERRAVLHVALRAPRGERIFVDGKDVVPEVHEVLNRMAAFSDKVRSGEWRGHTGN